jgi:hypothetical protein
MAARLNVPHRAAHFTVARVAMDLAPEVALDVLSAAHDRVHGAIVAFASNTQRLRFAPAHVLQHRSPYCQKMEFALFRSAASKKLAAT